MHTNTMPDSAGTFSDRATKAQDPCPYCGSTTEHYYTVWESDDGAYEDYKHECRACGKNWWVDGIDS